MGITGALSLVYWMNPGNQLGRFDIQLAMHSCKLHIGISLYAQIETNEKPKPILIFLIGT